jgi:hypothetical protein
MIFALTFPRLIVFIGPCIVIVTQNCGGVKRFIHLLLVPEQEFGTCI